MENSPGNMHLFLSDLITLIQEKYNQSLQAEEREDEQRRSFRLGASFAYYDVLDLIESQLEAFGVERGAFGEIAPVPGQKIPPHPRLPEEF